MLKRDTRYQGAVVNNHQILLIKHKEHKTGRSYWAIPGGGMEPGETEEECVRREMNEETNLDVKVISLQMDEPDYHGGTYKRLKTFLSISASSQVDFVFLAILPIIFNIIFFAIRSTMILRIIMEIKNMASFNHTA